MTENNVCQSNKVRCTQIPLVTAIDYTNKQNDHAMIQTTYLEIHIVCSVESQHELNNFSADSQQYALRQTTYIDKSLLYDGQLSIFLNGLSESACASARVLRPLWNLLL